MEAHPQQYESRFRTTFRAENDLTCDEAHLPMRGLLDVLHLVRPSRPYQGQPRPIRTASLVEGQYVVFLTN